MPYIDNSRRNELDDDFSCDGGIDSTGELNYLITRLIRLYRFEHGMSYNTINDIIGALEGAKLEFYRRVAVPYEDTKKMLNGDVY